MFSSRPKWKSAGLNLVGLLAALACIACSSGKEAQPQELPEAAGLPGFPAPSTLEARGSSWSGGYIAPIQADKQGYPINRITEDFGRDCIGFRAFGGADAELDSYGYCIYSTETSGDTFTLSFEWTTPPPAGTFYCGFADFAANRWDWYPAPAPDDSLQINAAAKYTDGSGFSLLALVQCGTPDGLLTKSELDAIRLECEPVLSGWQFTRAAEFSAVSPIYTYGSQLVEHQGKPVILYELADASENVSVNCVHSSTALGQIEADWSTVELLATSSQHHVDLDSIGAELCFAAFTTADSSLHFRTAGEPGAVWTDQVTAVSGFPTFPEQLEIGSLAGEPVLSFHIGPDIDGVDPADLIGYGFMDGQGDWQLSTVQDLGWQGNLSNFTQPFDVGGLPLVLFGMSGGVDGYGLYCSQASSATPAGAADWTPQRIASAQFDDFRLGLGGDLLAGRPCVVATHTQFTDPPEVTFFHLPVDDPAPANWLIHNVQYFNFEGISQHAFAVVNDRPALLNDRVTYEGSLATYSLDLYHGNMAMPAGEADWTLSVPSPDCGVTIADIAEVNGQPAIAMLQQIKGLNDVTLYKLIYGAYVP